jgi:hypothetical protein
MIRKSQLSPARRRLVESLCRLDYGQVQNLVLQAGEPVLDPPPAMIREWKPGKTQRTVAPEGDFALKAEWIDLLRLMDEMPDGVICRIEVQAGLPYRVCTPQAVS